MKMKSLKILLLIALVVSGQLYAQTKTNVAELQKLAKEYNADYEAAMERVKAYTEANNVPANVTSKDGSYIEMIDVVDGSPVYRIFNSHGAAITTRANELWPGGSTGINISGAGYDKAGQWDAGLVRTSHQEFTDQGPSRVTNMEGGSTHFHATNVAGVTISAGVKNAAKGSAYGAKLKAWNSANDKAEMANAAAGGLEISNHSYGGLTGWTNQITGSWQWMGNTSISPDEDYKFGYYNTDARKMDQISFNAPNYLIIRSAGNDRGEGPPNADPEKDGGTDGYDCLPSVKTAKNILTVGAVEEVENYTGPQSVKISYFSSWGPADDGRIKPDIVGKGEGIYTADVASNTAYVVTQGTSFSSPNVSGSTILLRQHHQSFTSGSPLRAATMKAIILHTADEAGANEGPDYIYGWGLMNTKIAAYMITDGQGQNSIDELVLSENDTYQRTITIPEGTPEIRVSLCWTDPAGIPGPYMLNNRNPMLVNDLDLELYNGSGNWYPYKLNPENPSAAATNVGRNNVDNYEQVYIKNPAPGNYTIKVNHEDDLDGGEQAFSLVITGISEYTVAPECSNGLNAPGDGATDILLNEWISWEPAPYASSYNVYFGTDGGGTQTPTNVYNGESVGTNGFTYLMDPSTTYYLKVVPSNNVGTATGCSEIYSFSTMDAIDSYPFLDKFTNISEPDIPFGYQSVDNSDGVWQSTAFIGDGDSKSMICLNKNGAELTDFDNWFISPPFAVEDGVEYAISNTYKSFAGNTNESMTVYWSDSPYIEDFSKVLYTRQNFASNNWLNGLGMARPEYDGVMFVGFHLTSDDGYGVLVDNLKVENWGPVGTGPESEFERSRIYSFYGNVVIEAGNEWQGADIRIMNIMGQEVYNGTFHSNATINVKQSANTGLYIVTLVKGENVNTQKVIIR